MGLEGIGLAERGCAGDLLRSGRLAINTNGGLLCEGLPSWHEQPGRGRVAAARPELKPSAQCARFGGHFGWNDGRIRNGPDNGMTPSTQQNVVHSPADLDSKSYWDGVAAGILRLQQCSKCRTVWFPPLPTCPSCGSSIWTEVESSGRGSIYSWVVVYRDFGGTFTEALPFVIPNCRPRRGRPHVWQVSSGRRTLPRLTGSCRVLYRGRSGPCWFRAPG